MFLFLSILLSSSFEAQCTPVEDGAAGSCKVCDTITNLCQTCNYEDEYAPNELGNCSLKPKPQCTPVEKGAAGSCEVCDANTNLCQKCNYENEYEPNEYGNCSKRVRCVAIKDGKEGSCSECNTTADLCAVCNHPDAYAPNELGNCTLKPRCVPIEKGPGGSCSICNEAADLCQTCNYPDKYEPNEYGNCTRKPTKCVVNNQDEPGTCRICNEATDLCQTCNHPEQYEPNQYGNCTQKLVTKCQPVLNGEGGTCAKCDPVADVCQECNMPENYVPNELGNCTLKNVQCVPVEYGAGGTCSICNESNLCEVCNYKLKYEPNQYGSCSKIPKCINVTDGAAGTCSICDPDNKLCAACNYPEIFEPDQKGGCVIKTQSQCTESYYGPPGTCSICNYNTHLCEICNYPYEYSPNPFGNCTRKNRNGCSDSVENCFRCNPEKPDVCIECQYKYGLRGGYCTKCPSGLYKDSRHPCNPDCSLIPNCRHHYKYDDDDCVLENGQLYCLECVRGYHPSEDFKSCVQNTPGNCSYEIPGCLECEYNGSSKCVKCDTEKNFVLDDDECECRKGFEYVLGECLRSKEVIVECDDSLKKCEKCAFNSSTCIECDDHYGLENNKCVKCEKGARVSGSLPCLKRCTAIQNCAFCSEDGKECFECEDGYEDSDDHTKCISEHKGDCAADVIGCKECSASDPHYCLKCDKKKHFDESEVFSGTCVCDEDYDYYDGQCYPPYSPATPPKGPEQQVQIDQENFTKYVIVTGSIYTIIADAPFLPGTLYILLIPITITEITIPRGPTNFQLTIPSSGNVVTVNADPTTQVDLSCPNGASIVIPEDNNNYVLKGNGLITIKPGIGKRAVIVRKITMDQTGNSLQLNSTEASITVKEVEIYGYQSFAGQSIAYRTKCEITKIQSGATFTPENISFTTLQIAIQSVLVIKGNSHVDISDYQVYYNSSASKIPIQFISPFPDFSKSKLNIFNMNKGQNLEGEETFNVASFQGENSKQACENFKLNAESDFNSAECQTFGDVTYKVAKKAAVNPDENPSGGKKKKGLSGGAIAGIVVGCVVAVGLVVFLCVWFLVIKKNQPAHKRSGEPANSREKLEI